MMIEDAVDRGCRGWNPRPRSDQRVEQGAPGDARPPKVLVKGRGTRLPDPVVPVPGGTTSVTAQVVTTASATCFGADFASPFQANKSNASGTTAVFKAKR